MAKAHAAGDTPKETLIDYVSSWPCYDRQSPRKTHQIGQRVEFLAHQARLISPPSNLPIHEVEEQAKWYEGQRRVQIAVVTRVA